MDLARTVAGIGGPVGVTVDGRAATAGTGQFLCFKYRLAPSGLATRRQLSALGLRPGGAEPVASLAWGRDLRRAYLYDVATAKPKRPMTAAKWAALGKAMRARRTCPDCVRDVGYVIPGRYGRCVDCQFGPAQAPTDEPIDQRWAA